ncbi:MAG TPA: hypothetical protein VG125_28345 [Pirellulales bacterium]|nr:hypothetical protein [Pirellulales bacterium]
MPPHIRTAQYQELLKQAAGMPAVTARLEGLCPALELPCELPTGQRPEVVELLDQVRRLFVLPRQERASRRLAFLQQCRTNWPQWQRVAIAVQAKIARLPSLEPELFRELCTSGNREKVRQKIARQRRRSSQKSRGPHTTTRNSSGNRWWMAIIVGVGLAIIRGSTSSHNPSPKPPLVPSSSPWTAQERERHRELGRSLVEIQNRLKQREAERAARPGQLPRNPAESLLPPPEKTSSPPPNPSLPPLPSGGVEIRIVKSPEEAQEMLRQLQEQQAQGGQQKGMPRVEMHNLNLDQAREFLRQLREQQAQGGPNTSRDAAIRALEQVLDEAGRNSQE